jgi:hypothetical protein
MEAPEMHNTASADGPNPYSSPSVETQPVSMAEREIAVVVRVFRWLGCLGAVVFGLGAGIWICELSRSFLKYAPIGAEPVSTEILFARSIVSLAMLGFSAALLRVAARMARHKPDARRKALILSSLMLIGFPLFTLIGFLCIQKVNRHYEAYCGERLDFTPE